MKVIEIRNKCYTVLDSTDPTLARDLSDEEVKEFEDWAAEHWQEEVRAIYHPVVQNTMLRLQEERKQ